MLSIYSGKSNLYTIEIQFNCLNEFQLEGSNWKEDTRSSKSESWTSQSSGFRSLNVRKSNSITQGIDCQTLFPSLTVEDIAKRQETSLENKPLNVIAEGLSQTDNNLDAIMDSYSKKKYYSFPKIFRVIKVTNRGVSNFKGENISVVQNWEQTQFQENLSEPPKFYIEKVVNASKADRKAENFSDSDEISLFKVFKITRNADLKRKSTEDSFSASEESFRVRKYFKIERILRKKKAPLKQFKFSDAESAFQKYSPVEVPQMSPAEVMAKMSTLMTSQFQKLINTKTPIQLLNDSTCKGLLPELRTSLAYKLLKSHNIDPLNNSGTTEGCLSGTNVMHMPIAQHKKL